MINAIDVLLVEDNEDDAELTLQALGNYHSLHLQDGLEALDFIFARNKYQERNIHILPKLILLDLKLPKLDGIDVLKEIKQHSITRLVPIVILTSSFQDSDLQACYIAGANSYLVKPDSFKKFNELIKLLCQYWLSANQFPR